MLFPEVLVGLDSAIRDRVIVCSWQQQAALTNTSPEGTESEVQFLDSGRGAGSRGLPGRSCDSGWRGPSQPAVTSREVARRINTPSSLLPPLSCQCPRPGILFFSPYRSSFRGRGQDGEESRATLGVQMEDTQSRRFVTGLDNWHGTEPGTQKIRKTWGLLWFLSVFPALVGLVFMYPAQPLWPHHNQKRSQIPSVAWEVKWLTEKPIEYFACNLWPLFFF